MAQQRGYAAAVALFGSVAVLLACGDDDAAAGGTDASLPSDAAVARPPTDAGPDTHAPRLDAAAPSDAGGRDGGATSCISAERDEALADSLCACEEPDGSTWPFVLDDAGFHSLEASWRVSLECVCALGHCRTLAQVARSESRACGCGKIRVQVPRGFNPAAYTYDLRTLELVGVRVGGSDVIQGMCDEERFVAGEVDIHECPDYQFPCELPEFVVPCVGD